MRAEEAPSTTTGQAITDSPDDENDSSGAADENDSSDADAENDAQEEEELSLEEKIRKAKVAAGGGALVVIGALLTPVPIIPGGIPLVAAGLHVLAQEFEEAKVAEDKLIENVNTITTRIKDEYQRQFAEIEGSMELRQNELASELQRDVVSTTPRAISAA